jgi:hypothetical protein
MQRACRENLPGFQDQAGSMISIDATDAQNQRIKAEKPAAAVRSRSSR